MGDEATAALAVTRSVAEAIRRSWIVAGEPSEVIERAANPSGGDRVRHYAVVVVARRKVEVVLDENSLSVEETDWGLDGLSRDGWDVSVVLPLHLMGQAHENFRGRNVRLRGWWQQAHQTHFGALERA